MSESDTTEREPADHEKKRTLRRGFSTGTAFTAAARAALRHLVTGEPVSVVAVRLPGGLFLPVPVREIYRGDAGAWASVIKDGGDDPDVTHKAEIRVRVRCLRFPEDSVERPGGLYLVGGKGVGVATKPGLPVKVGEPAINPVPREMLLSNLCEELMRWGDGAAAVGGAVEYSEPEGAYVFLPHERSIDLEILVEVPKGEELARHTLNPRLGVVGGISILGTTGIVKPFSNAAYEETIQAALSVAVANGCGEVVLSTGGKSERLAMDILRNGRPSPITYRSESYHSEAFVQIADFFAFSVRESRRLGFRGIVHSVFFGKALKMAQGHAYTHAHRAALELEPLARLASGLGYDESLCASLASANTARQALEHLMERGAMDVVGAVARQALEQSVRIAGVDMTVRLLLFDYNGTLLSDVQS